MDYNLTAQVEQFLTLDKEKDDNHQINISADIPKETFMAITEDSLSEDGITRTIQVQLMKLENAVGGPTTIHSAVFVRADEKKVLVSLLDVDGKEVAQTATNFGIKL